MSQSQFLGIAWIRLLRLGLYALAFTSLLSVSLSFAADKKTTPQQATQAKTDKSTRFLRNTIQESLGEEVASIEPSTLPGFYDVQLAEGNHVLVKADGKYMIAGDLYELRTPKLINHTEIKKSKWRKTQLAKVKKRDLLVFGPKTPAKTHVNIFTDVDCGYCRRLHQDVPLLNRYGIEIRYLAFPRAGVGSPTYSKMVTAWCANDARRNLTRLKNGEEIPTKLCLDNPVSEQYELGKRLGVRGTPAIFTAEGDLLPGYLPPEELAKYVGVR